MSEDYRVNPVTGAVSIKRTPEERRKKEFLGNFEAVQQKLRSLEKFFFETKRALEARIEGLEKELARIKHEDKVADR